MTEKLSYCCLLIVIIFSISKSASAQNVSPPSISTNYEASPAFPFGRLNPNAPPETKQFDFIIGEFDCNDRIFNPQDGKWYDMKVMRRAAYILNGHAIQDQNWLPIFNTSNMRMFDTKEKKWKVTYFKMPTYQTGIWTGEKTGDEIVLKQGTDEKGSRLTFFDIKADEYSWKAESLTDGKAKLTWQFTCKRRR